MGSLGKLSLSHPWGFPHPLRESPEQLGVAQELVMAWRPPPVQPGLLSSPAASLDIVLFRTNF